MGIIRRRDNGTYYCDGHYCGFTLAWFSCDPEEYGAEGEWVCLDCSASMFASAPPSQPDHARAEPLPAFDKVKP